MANASTSVEPKVPRGTRGSRSGVSEAHEEKPARSEEVEADGYDWGVEVAGSIRLKGLKLLTSNRAVAKILGPLRLT